jgi:phospholipase/carboxylesterase
MQENDIHQNQPVFTYGASLEQARLAVIMLHGRGASAEDILTLAYELDLPDTAYLAPQAFQNTWYPYRFLEPTARNEPWLSSALGLVGRIASHLAETGFGPEKTVLLGFSQGACLALEYAVRNPQAYAGLVGLSGGLIGTDEEVQGYSGSLAGVPVFMGCDAQDPHIPRSRVDLTAQVLEQMGAQTTVRIYPDLGHSVNQDELVFVRGMLGG